jgi:hypothetical protein
MEDSRCKIAATTLDDPRCKSLLLGVAIEMDDPRCKSLLYSAVIGREDLWYGSGAREMEDSRCRNWHLNR